MVESILFRLDNALENSLKSGQILVTILTGLAAVYVIRRVLAPSPLSNIPGPPSPSFFAGHLLALTSGTSDVSFCNEITEKYGGVVKLKTSFGVCLSCLFIYWCLLTLEMQSDMLYVSDPLALHHIQKEVDIFRKPLYVAIYPFDQDTR